MTPRTAHLLIDLAKAKPNELLFGSSGNGGLPHLSDEQRHSGDFAQYRYTKHRCAPPRRQRLAQFFVMQFSCV